MYDPDHFGFATGAQLLDGMACLYERGRAPKIRTLAEPPRRRAYCYAGLNM